MPTGNGPASYTNANRAKVLLVDDDSRFLVSLRRGLTLRDFDVETVEETGKALRFLDAAWPDVVLLDVTMPGMDGISFCGLVRERYAVPILMLTARDAIEDKVSGLQAGADDYVIKPFDLEELVARIHALLRRSGVLPQVRRLLRYHDLELDPVKWVASRNDEKLTLTTTEFKLLACFMQEPERVFPRSELLDKVWGDGSGFESNVVDVHVANLRRKLEEVTPERIIRTVTRAGYKLQAS